jgi:hypothetical protein
VKEKTVRQIVALFRYGSDPVVSDGSERALAARLQAFGEPVASWAEETRALIRIGDYGLLVVSVSGSSVTVEERDLRRARTRYRAEGITRAGMGPNWKTTWTFAFQEGADVTLEGRVIEGDPDGAESCARGIAGSVRGFSA